MYVCVRVCVCVCVCVCKKGVTHCQPEEPEKIGQEGQALQEGCEDNEVNHIPVVEREREGGRGYSQLVPQGQ